MRKVLTTVGTFAVTTFMMALASPAAVAAVTAKTYHDF